MTEQTPIAERLAGAPTPDWVSGCGTVVLYNADCLEVLRRLPGESIDALIMDPPYCSGGATEAARGRSTHQGLRSGTIRNGRFSWFDSDNMTTAGLCELLRSVCVAARVNQSGSIACFCDWRMVTSVSPAMESAGLRLRNICVWDKGHFGCGTGFRPQHELILHLTKRAPTFYSQSVGNVLRCSREGDRVHPTQKPEGILADVFVVVVPEAGTSCDPFMGSGTSGVVAVRLKRQFIGIEIDADYFAIAVKRIEAELNRHPLFTPPAPRQAGLFTEGE